MDHRQQRVHRESGHSGYLNNHAPNTPHPLFTGVAGNTAVVLTLAKTPKLWTATNVFIANLAIADISACMLDLPLSAYYQITDDWIFGEVLCMVRPLGLRNETSISCCGINGINPCLPN